MTRLFTEDGEHMPVTVLQAGQLPGRRAAHRREGRLYRPPARCRHAQGQERHQAACAATSPRRRSSRSARWPSSACRRGALIEVGAEITADHFVAGQFVDVAGTCIGKGFAGRDEAPQFRRLARHPRRVGLAPQPRLDRQRQDPGKAFKNKKMAGHMGDERVTTQNLEVFDRRRPRPDHGRGRGAGRQGRLGPG